MRCVQWWNDALSRRTQSGSLVVGSSQENGVLIEAELLAQLLGGARRVLARGGTKKHRESGPMSSGRRRQTRGLAARRRSVTPEPWRKSLLAPGRNRHPRVLAARRAPRQRPPDRARGPRGGSRGGPGGKASRSRSCVKGGKVAKARFSSGPCRPLLPGGRTTRIDQSSGNGRRARSGGMSASFLSSAVDDQPAVLEAMQADSRAPAAPRPSRKLVDR